MKDWFVGQGARPAQGPAKLQPARSRPGSSGRLEPAASRAVAMPSRTSLDTNSRRPGKVGIEAGDFRKAGHRREVEHDAEIIQLYQKATRENAATGYFGVSGQADQQHLKKLIHASRAGLRSPPIGSRQGGFAAGGGWPAGVRLEPLALRVPEVEASCLPRTRPCSPLGPSSPGQVRKLPAVKPKAQGAARVGLRSSVQSPNRAALVQFKGLAVLQQREEKIKNLKVI